MRFCTSCHSVECVWFRYYPQCRGPGRMGPRADKRCPLGSERERQEICLLGVYPFELYSIHPFFIISTRAVWDSTAKRGTHITHSKHAAGPKKRVSPRARRAREGRAMFSYFPPETHVLLGLQRKRIFWYNAQGTGHHGDGELKVSKSFFKTSIKHCEIKSSVLEDIVLN